MRKTMMLALSAVLVSAVLLSACRSAVPLPQPPAKPGAAVISRWSGKTELFLESPALVAGRAARLAVHFTDLVSFKPVAEGKVTVELRPASGPAESFSADPSSRPGIFGVDVKPGAAGTYAMTVRLEAGDLRDAHEAGPVQVYADEAAAAKAPSPPEIEAVSFLKEQQWTLEFATEVVEERALRESIRVPAEIRPRTGGEAEVLAPLAGRIAVSGSIPGLGEEVREGQVLAAIVPRTATPADRASLNAAAGETGAALDLAVRDRERAERLLAVGAVPAKRLDEAKAAEAAARARSEAAQERLRQHEASRRSEGDLPEDSRFLLRAPIGGVIAASRATPGAGVEEGTSLFRIVSTDRVHVVASVPEAEVGRLANLAGGEMEVPGLAAPLPLGKIIAAGRVVDPDSRTVPVVFALAPGKSPIAVGQSVYVRLFAGAGSKAPAVPESAIVDDAGRPVVFVQAAGESFLRRPVRLGGRESGRVHVLEGLASGERVVTRGAYQIRLAALSTQVPAHGHVH